MPCLNIHQNPNPIHQLAPLLFICNNSTKQWSISHGYKPMVKGMPICSSDKCPRCTLQKYELVRKGILGTRISRIGTCDYWHHLPDTAMKWIWALRNKAPINWSSMYCQLMCLKDAFKSTGQGTLLLALCKVPNFDGGVIRTRAKLEVCTWNAVMP
jgi:hypothetical protein